MYLGLLLIFCTIIKIKKNKGMWINLNLKNILENSKGNKKYSTLILPISDGKEIYCSKNEAKGILVKNNISKKNKIIVSEPRNA